MNEFSKDIRRKILNISFFSKSSHLGCCLSIVDLLSVLYSNILNVNADNLKDPARDRFILSKGHAALALYAVLAKKGFFLEDRLSEYYMDEGLAGHPCHGSLPGIETSTGSLGHGLSVGVGMALGAKIDNLNYKTIVLLGDGECNEGSVWEAVMFAASKKLDNITAIIDNNNCQGYASCEKVLDMGNFKSKFSAFGWDVINIDGHDHSQINEALVKSTDKPKAIIAKTVHGKGVSFIEDDIDWHYKSMDEKLLKQTLKEIDKL